jgi:hypothetical protein
VTGGETAEAAWWSAPDGGGPDGFTAGIAILIGALVVAVVLIPLLLFGVELSLVAVLIAASSVGRGLLGRPWVVQARCAENPPRTLAWKVVGWRRSSRLIDEVVASLANGRDPAPAEAAERITWTAGAPYADLEQKR